MAPSPPRGQQPKQGRIPSIFGTASCRPGNADSGHAQPKRSARVLGLHRKATPRSPRSIPTILGSSLIFESWPMPPVRGSFNSSRLLSRVRDAGRRDLDHALLKTVRRRLTKAVRVGPAKAWQLTRAAEDMRSLDGPDRRAPARRQHLRLTRGVNPAAFAAGLMSTLTIRAHRPSALQSPT